MKSTLIIQLIRAHSSGSEDAFKKALKDLADDEERKGNAALAASLQSAYSQGNKLPANSPSPMTEMSFSVQGASPAPKDKDSALELLEVMQPKIKLEDVVLPEKTKEVLMQIVEEQIQAKDLLARGVLATNREFVLWSPWLWKNNDGQCNCRRNRYSYRLCQIGWIGVFVFRTDRNKYS